MKKSIVMPIMLAACLASCKSEKKQALSTASEVTFKEEGQLTVFRKDTILVPSLSIEIADNDFETQTGLMYRNSMDKNQGMLFVFEDEAPRSFYMKNTQIALDIIYLNGNGKIVSFAKNAQPMSEQSLPSGYPAKYVLEVVAGLADEWGLKQGDSISFTKN